jgi:hypothetical protein
MKPEKALELVRRYAALNRSMKSIKTQIGEHLSKCKGHSGMRLDPHYSTGEIDSKGRELDVHLTGWYTPERGEYGSTTFHDINAEEQGIECPHCYEAHLLIQQRKLIRKEFGSVKSQISRSAP